MKVRKILCCHQVRKSSSSCFLRKCGNDWMGLNELGVEIRGSRDWDFFSSKLIFGYQQKILLNHSRSLKMRETLTDFCIKPRQKNFHLPPPLFKCIKNPRSSLSALKLYGMPGKTEYFYILKV
jgi:hypothetical protein